MGAGQQALAGPASSHRAGHQSTGAQHGYVVQAGGDGPVNPERWVDLIFGILVVPIVVCILGVVTGLIPRG